MLCTSHGNPNVEDEIDILKSFCNSVIHYTYQLMFNMSYHVSCCSLFSISFVPFVAFTEFSLKLMHQQFCLSLHQEIIGLHSLLFRCFLCLAAFFLSEIALHCALVLKFKMTSNGQPLHIWLFNLYWKFVFSWILVYY